MTRFAPLPLRRTLATAGLGLLLLAPAAHAAELQRVDPAASRIAFTYKQMGVAMDGRFGKFDIDLAFDPAKPESGRTAIAIELASIDAGSAEANDEVVGKAWFDAKAHPKAVFKSTGVKALGGNRFEAQGTLTIKGRSQPVSAPFTFTPQGEAGIFDGSFVIRRADFAIGEGDWADFGIVANEITVKFHVLAAR